MRDFHFPGRSEVFAQNGMCATSHPLAAQVAVSLLQSGGNAVDAAIGAAVLLGICEPQMTGIGGDCFALISKPGQGIIGLNGSGRAPKRLTADALRQAGHKTMPLYDAACVNVPGAVDAFCRLSQDHGRLGLDAVLAPAIHYADTGVPVAPRVAFDWPTAAAHLSESGRKHYLVNGAVPKAGTIFRAPGQAEALRRIARLGRAGFYEGPVADDMVRSLRAAGGVHSLEDFADTACTYVTPVETDYHGVRLVELPPNGQGATALLIANMLAHFAIAGMDPTGAERAHIEAEVTRLAYDARDRIIADATHVSKLDHMLSRDTAAALAGLVDPQRARAEIAPLTSAIHKDTVYLTVVDRDRMAVSLIYSIFHGFGSGIASDEYGILFQNRGAGFSLQPGHPNELAGGKRSMHTIIPAFLQDPGGALVPFGVMGGAYQATGHARFLSNIADFGMSLQEAIDAPRCFADPSGELRIERGYGDDVRDALTRMGHKVAVPDGPIGGAQAIRIDPASGVLVGASDFRKDGCALGY